MRAEPRGAYTANHNGVRHARGVTSGTSACRWGRYCGCSDEGEIVVAVMRVKLWLTCRLERDLSAASLGVAFEVGSMSEQQKTHAAVRIPIICTSGYILCKRFFFILW